VGGSDLNGERRLADACGSDANESRDWRIYADFARRLISQARGLYAGDVRLHRSKVRFVGFASRRSAFRLCVANAPFWAPGLGATRPFRFTGSVLRIIMGDDSILRLQRHQGTLSQ
jgi:hypothetical protein